MILPASKPGGSIALERTDKLQALASPPGWARTNDHWLIRPALSPLSYGRERQIAAIASTYHRFLRGNSIGCFLQQLREPEQFLQVAGKYKILITEHLARQIAVQVGEHDFRF